MDVDRGKKIVLVHDWLTGMRGGEKCLIPVARRWPHARLLTLLHRRGSVVPEIENLVIQPSVLNQFPGVHRYYRYLLPIMPIAAGWRVSAADLVLSFSHCVAKSAQAPAGVPHVSYCFTPMRYAWHMQDAYFRQRGLKNRMISMILRRIREWDRRTADRVTHFIAISQTVRDRIRESYGRESTIIYPPVDTNFYTPSTIERENFYLVVSALAPYKRFDLAIEACRKLNRRLVVIGSGQELRHLKASSGPNIQFLGWQSDDVIRDHYRRAKALLFPGEEDFGIVPVEAQACGCPVIAYGQGGATETIRPLGRATEPTGLFFDEQSPNAIIDAMERFEQNSDHFDPRAARRQAITFRKERYEEELIGYLDRLLDQKRVNRSAA